MASVDVCLDCSRTVHDTGYIRRGQDILYVTCRRLLPHTPTAKKTYRVSFYPFAEVVNEHVS